MYPALEAGAIDAADFVGPAINYSLGFADVTDYIVMGPPSTPCLHQPVDIMEISFNLRTWNALPDHLQAILTDQVRGFSSLHFTGIQSANVEAWAKFAEAGITVTRLSEDDVAQFRWVAIPLWFEWANKDADAARVFKLHLEVMQNPSVAYLTPDDIKNYELRLYLDGHLRVRSMATSVDSLPAAAMKRPRIAIVPRTIRGKLGLAFGVVAATAVVAAVVGQSAYELVNEKLATITDVSVPSMVAAQRIGEVTAQIAAAAPALHGAATEIELDVQLDRLNAYLAELQPSGAAR